MDAPFFSIGMVIKNDAGNFVSGKCMKVEGKVPVLEAEAFGECEALRIKQTCHQPASIESDSLQVVVHTLNSEVCYQVWWGIF